MASMDSSWRERSLGSGMTRPFQILLGTSFILAKARFGIRTERRSSWIVLGGIVIHGRTLFRQRISLPGIWVPAALQKIACSPYRGTQAGRVQLGLHGRKISRCQGL